jgi:hypothetical protein
MTTTQLGLLRGAGGPEDPYEPGTSRERAYMCSVTMNTAFPLQNTVVLTEVEMLAASQSTSQDDGVFEYEDSWDENGEVL